jgi:N-acyl-D-aspartate/D-glutamate deacylase
MTQPHTCMESNSRAEVEQICFVAPVRHKDADRSMLSMERNEAIPYEAMKATMPFSWETFPEWMDHIDRLPKLIRCS